jgi:NAD(P)H dehydrogenase (quinone)
MEMRTMYAIMGATGQVGGAAAAALLRQGHRVRAVVRDAGRVLSRLPGVSEVAVADAAHVESLAAAFAGTRGVFVLNPPRVTAHDVLAEARAASAAIAEAARRARVPHVVALSSQGAHLAAGTGIVRSLHDFEAALRATSVPVTFIRAGNFMENWAAGLTPARADGVLPSLVQPLDARSETVSIRDVGTAVAEALAAPIGRERVVNLWGPDSYAPADAAAILSDLLGRPVQAVAPPRAAWEAALIEAGLGADYARLLTALHDAINAERIPFEPGVGDLRRGRTTLREALAALVNADAGHAPVPA